MSWETWGPESAPWTEPDHTGQRGRGEAPWEGRGFPAQDSDLFHGLSMCIYNSDNRTEGKARDGPATTRLTRPASAGVPGAGCPLEAWVLVPPAGAHSLAGAVVHARPPSTSGTHVRAAWRNL